MAFDDLCTLDSEWGLKQNPENLGEFKLPDVHHGSVKRNNWLEHPVHASNTNPSSNLRCINGS